MLCLFGGCAELQQHQQNVLAVRMACNDFIQEHSTPEMKALIAENKIAVGMNALEVSASIGRPHRKNVSTYSWGEHEQWEYLRNSDHGRMYLYFEDSILRSWQNNG